MSEVFVISDTHFGHKGVLNFTHEGKPLRPFRDLDEMHYQMVSRWNKVVGPQDKVYHLGDVAFGAEGLKIMGLLNGKKRLVRGNHDLMSINKYRQYFQEIYGVRQINGLWLTHVPMHPMSLDRKGLKKNVHGHLHANVVMRDVYGEGPPFKVEDERYFNASVERINYTPVSIDEI